MYRKIIYLDDEIDLLDIFIELHANEFREIKVFNDYQKALFEIAQFPPDLLILDQRLPSTTGTEIAKKISNDIPKILITGDLSVESPDLFLRVFSKPYLIQEMEDFLQGCKSGSV